MPLFQLDIEKQLGNEFWTNVYYLNAPTGLPEAVTNAQSVITVERNIHKTIVTFTRARVRTAVEGDELYTIIPLGLAGLATLSGDYIPLFNTVNAILAPGAGRPSRKYYRTPVGEGEQVNGVLASTVVTAINTQLARLLPGGDLEAGLNDVDGQQIISSAVVSAVGMHQLRRGSRRRATPVLPAS